MTSSPALAAQQLVAVYVDLLNEWNADDVDDDKVSNMLAVLGTRITEATAYLSALDEDDHDALHVVIRYPALYPGVVQVLDVLAEHWPGAALGGNLIVCNPRDQRIERPYADVSAEHRG